MTDALKAGAHLLIVDDDQRIRALLSRYLAAEGYVVSAAANAQEARDRLRERAFDLLVLDVMMPGESGVDFAAFLRASEEPLRSAPVLMLTALGEAAQRIRGLEAGADDYLPKPFDPRELSLRIAGILRRTRRSESPDPRIFFGRFVYDPARRELLCDESPIHLTTREHELLRVLAEQAGAAVSRQRLAQRAASDRSVDVEITRLRRKIEADPNAPRHLQTVRGQGYRLLADPPRRAVS